MKPQDINWDEWEEIKAPAIFRVSDPNILEIVVEGISYYFKKKEVWPKIWNNTIIYIRVNEDGKVEIQNMPMFPDKAVVDTLLEALECAKKQLGRTND